MGYVAALQGMLGHYWAVVGVLTPTEGRLLAGKLEQLERCLDPGFSPLNWNALGIPDFVAAANKAINEFQALVNQVSALKTRNASFCEDLVLKVDT